MNKYRVALRGEDLLNNPIYNKGTAFTAQERRDFRLEGLLPSKVTTIDEQCRRFYASITRKTDPLEQYIGLTALQNRNQTLYYRILHEYVDDFLPIVYTPTVGQACQQYSRIIRKARGIWITPEHKGRIKAVLHHANLGDIRLIVVTDNERILGLGDQGAGGMGIPIGKLALYIMGAGIHPQQTLPVSLDVGTDNEDLLNDPYYLGWPHRRLRGEEYAELVEEFVLAVKHLYPRALLQWEDFLKQNAFDLLERYRDRILCFNDDIQGTAAVAVAGIITACRATGTALQDQRIMILGAGAAGIGIARLIQDRLRRIGMVGEELTKVIALCDSKGLLVDSRRFAERSKATIAWPAALAEKMGISEAAAAQYEALADIFKPTVIIGTTGTPGMFTERLISGMARHTEQPVVMPFSNPNSKAEAHPEEIIRWTDGRALVATGSPFPVVEHKGRQHIISQGNNVYIFPGIGLGALVAEASKVTEPMFAAAAEAVAEMVRTEELAQGALYPSLTRLREVSARIAEAVVKEARDSGIGRHIRDENISGEVDKMMWFPEYAEYEAVDNSRPV
ncbi:MAG: NAD-dependent malic enzyme [Chromatiales bacterium]